MLGQLLNWTPSRRSAGHPLSRGGSHDSQHGLESVTEDAHTQALLFPAAPNNSNTSTASRDFAVALNDAAAPGPFDDCGPESGLPSESDVRILVAQDDSAGLPKAVLFDSRPPQTSATASSPASDRPPSSFNVFRERLPPNDPPALNHSFTLPSHGRRPSQPQTQTDLRSGRGSVSSGSSSFFRQSSDPPWQGPQPQRGHVRGVSNSSATGAASSRRLAKDADEELQSCLECMFGSAALRYTGRTTKVHILSKDQAINPWDRTGSSGGTFNLQPVARPTTSSSTRPSLPRLHSRFGSFSDDKSSRKILITRVFSIQRRPSESGINQQAGTSVGETPQPTAGAARPRRQPVYAVSLLIRIPAHHSTRKRQPRSPLSSDFLSSWSSSLVSDSARSSHGSDSMLESTIFDTNFGSLSSLADVLDDDDSMSSVTRHWVVINKALDQMQRAVEKQVLTVRDQAGYHLRRTGSLPGSLNRPPIPQAAQSEATGLQPYSLAGDDVVEAAAESAAARLGQVFTVRQAVSGQGRWGIWKEEARWIDRWARTSEHSTMFTDLLSAFLANNAAWIETYEAGLFKRKAKRGGNFSNAHSARTVIVSNNKMKARRFIFLLAAFLPRSGEVAQLQDGTPFGSERGDGLASPARLSRNNTSRSEFRLEQTAPAGLRRNSKDHGRRYSSRHLSDLSAAIEMSRGGSARSRTSASFQTGSPGQDRFTTTDLNVANMPVAHFAPAAPDVSLKLRKGSSASARLLENLQTIPASAIASPQQSPVANRSRKTSIDFRPDQQRPPSVFGTSPNKQENSEATVTGPAEAGNKLEQMVTRLEHTGQTSSIQESSKLLTGDATSKDKASAPRDIPTPRQKPSDPPDMPFSLSINEKDGFVDVEIPLESYGASLQSLSSRDQSERGHNALPMPPRRATSDLAVGGYLQSFCQDLTLQAVKPYNNLENDLRSALSNDSSTGVSSRSSSATDKSRAWPVKSSILIVNIDTGDIRSVCLRAAPAPSPKADTRSTLLDLITDDAVTPDATDARLAAAISKILVTTHDMPSRASSTRARGLHPLISGAGSNMLSSSPASSAGTSIVGTPPGPGFSAMSDSVRGDGAGKVLFEALEEVVKAAKSSDGGAHSSYLVRAVHDRLAAL